MFIFVGIIIYVSVAVARDSMVLMEPPVKPSPELKNMLLENLNKHGNTLDELEPLQAVKSKGSTTFTSKTKIELSDNKNSKSGVADSDDLPFDVNEVSTLFDDSDLTRPDTDKVPFKPLANFEESFRPQPLSLNTLHPPIELPPLSLTDSGQQQHLVPLSYRPLPPSADLKTAQPPASNFAGPPAPPASPGTIGFQQLVPPNQQFSSFPSLQSQNPSFPAFSNLPSHQNPSFPSFLSPPSQNPFTHFDDAPPSAAPSPPSGAFPGFLSQSQSSLNPPSLSPPSLSPNPPNVVYPSLSQPQAPSQQPSSSLLPSQFPQHSTHPDSQVKALSASLSSPLQTAPLLSELPSSTVNASRLPSLTLPALIPLPDLQFAEEWSRGIRTTTVAPLLNIPIYSTQILFTTTLAPLDIKQWRNRFYKTFKRINKRKKLMEQKNKVDFVRDSEVIVNKKPDSEDQKLFDVEKSGYEYARVQHGRPQTPGLQNRLKEYAFNGSRPSDIFHPLSLKAKAGDSKEKLRKAKVQPLPQRKFKVNNDLEPHETPCLAVGCDEKSHNPWIFQNDVVLDNTDTCNNDKLRTLAEKLIVPSDAEASKRLIQKQFEEEFGRFFNVICGTGFYSYIAHTDDFCLVNVQDMNCYIFSPVCTDSQGLGNGVLKQRKKKSLQTVKVNSSRVL
ncbi:unnamed protein product [Bursaphelenchus okinawaensis]|uniref:Ground-like domain-containing protein n=1 Tax=Bursaphelenchus okinawaensis TaxID=465554 RepID=A0A811L8T7_9BILA|nr:unnamed protein product [Bursaphelenchus okinawaensis]CAG9120141.1 unnamed protein product [Bursaphelenchus okinawaensis]